MSNGNQPATDTGKSNAAANAEMQSGWATGGKQSGFQAPEQPMPAAPTVGPSRFVRQTPTAPAFRFTGAPTPSQPTQYAAQAPQMAPGGGFTVPQQGYSIAQMAQMYNPYAAQQAAAPAPVGPPTPGGAPGGLQNFGVQGQPDLTGYQPPQALPVLGPGVGPWQGQPEAVGQLQGEVAPGEEGQPGEFGQLQGAVVGGGVKQPSGHALNTQEYHAAEEGGYAGATQDKGLYHFNPQDPEGLTDEQFADYMSGMHNTATLEEATWRPSELAQPRTDQLNAQYDSAFEIQRRRMGQEMASAGMGPGSPASQQKQQGLNAAFYRAKIEAMELDQQRSMDQELGEKSQNEANIRIEAQEYMNYLNTKWGTEDMVTDNRVWQMLDAQIARFIDMGIDANHVRPYLQALMTEWNVRTGLVGKQRSGHGVGPFTSWNSDTYGGGAPLSEE